MEYSGFSKATVGRLPLYLQYLRRLPVGIRMVSAAAIARELDLGEVQVRKDLCAVCGKGKPRIGYETAVLIASIERALGSGSTCEAVIVGAGRLGTALLGFGGFSEYGITILRAFDSAPEKCSSPKVLPVENLPEYCALHQVEIGILTVPPDAAQQTAELLVRSGVRAIWCFAPVKLRLGPDIAVHYENLALSLAHLHQRVKALSEH